ncbi:MAG TPA: hypothetical protein ENL06_01025 [Candidatus Portnoybacteria bacterium]|nr:hypothetical protein [Candidatus Portnoybacteria bacterium]
MTKSKQYAIALYQTVKNKNEQEIQKLLGNFFSIVKKNGDRFLLKQILNHFQQIAQKNGDLNHLKIITAQGYKDLPLSADWNEVKKEIQPNIIGGVIAIINHQYLIDNSIKGKINKIMFKPTV